jgi:hypothetical protein
MVTVEGLLKAQKLLEEQGMSHDEAKAILSQVRYGSQTKLLTTNESIYTTKVEPTTMDIPDRLSIEPFSKYYNPRVAFNIDVYFKGEKRSNVLEYCISEGWVRVVAGKARDRHGRAMAFKLNGKVVVTLKGAGITVD